jgi:hypothetical protein
MVEEVLLIFLGLSLAASDPPLQRIPFTSFNNFVTLFIPPPHRRSSPFAFPNERTIVSLHLEEFTRTLSLSWRPCLFCLLLLLLFFVGPCIIAYNTYPLHITSKLSPHDVPVKISMCTRRTRCPVRILKSDEWMTESDGRLIEIGRCIADP